MLIMNTLKTEAKCCNCDPALHHRVSLTSLQVFCVFCVNVRLVLNNKAKKKENFPSYKKGITVLNDPYLTCLLWTSFRGVKGKEHLGQINSPSLDTDTHTNLNTHVTGLWQETGAPGENQHWYRENMQTPFKDSKQGLSCSDGAPPSSMIAQDSYSYYY